MPDSFNPFDLFVIAIAVLSTFWGGMRGVVSQITSILSWLASWYVATHYYSFVARFIDQDSEWRVPASMVITFIVTALAIRLASNFIKQIISFAGLREFDRQMGALLGLCKGLLLCFMVAFLAVVASEKSRTVVENAKTGPFFVKTVAYVQDKLPESELTRKFRSIAMEIDEQDERSDQEEDREAEIDNLTKELISKGFLSNNASKIVEEAVETRTESSPKDTQTSSNAFQSFLNKAAEWKEEFSSLANGERSSKTGASSGSNTPAGRKGSASPAVDDAVGDAREYYSFDSARGALSASSKEQNYYGAPDQRGQTRESSNNGYYETNSSISASSAPDSPNQSVENASSSFSGLASFLNTFGGGFDGGNVGSSSVRSYSGTSSTPGYNGYPLSSDDYDSVRTTATSQATSRTRNSRSTGSSDSRARLSSRSYTIGTPTDY